LLDVTHVCKVKIFPAPSSNMASKNPILNGMNTT